jgi:hypothetical protein
MPSDHGLRFHNDQNIRPARPYVPQSVPEETVEPVQGGPRPFSFEHGDLLPQSKDFKRSIQTTEEEDADGSQECGDQMEHESTVVTSHDTCTARPRPGSQAADLNTSVTFDYGIASPHWHEARDVTAAEWGRGFPEKDWVNTEAVRLLG